MSKFSTLQVRSPCSQGHSVVLNPTQDLRIILPGSKWTLENPNEFIYGYVLSQYINNKDNTVFEIKQIYDLTDIVKRCAFFLGKLCFKNHDTSPKCQKSSTLYLYAHQASNDYCLKTGKVCVLNPTNQTVKVSLGQVVEAIVTFKSPSFNEKCEPKWSILPTQSQNNLSKYIKILRTELFGFDVPESYSALNFSENHPFFSARQWDLSRIPLNPTIPKNYYGLIKEAPTPNVQFHIWFYILSEAKEYIRSKSIENNEETVDLGRLFIVQGDHIWNINPMVSYRSLKDEIVDRTDLIRDGSKAVFNPHQKVYLSEATFNPNPQDTINIERTSFGHLIELMSPAYLTGQHDMVWNIDHSLRNKNENLIIKRLASRVINSSYVDRFYLSPTRVDKTKEDEKIYLGYFSLYSQNDKFSLKKAITVWLLKKKSSIVLPELVTPTPVLRNKKRKTRYHFSSLKELEEHYSGLYPYGPPFVDSKIPKKIKKYRFVEFFDVNFGTYSVHPMVLINASKKNENVLPSTNPSSSIKKNLTLIQNLKIINAQKEGVVNVDKESTIITIDKVAHGDAIVVNPGDRIRLALPIPENEVPWLANVSVFGTVKNIVLESIEPLIPGTNIQYFNIGFFWRDLTTEKPGHHLIGGIKFVNQSSYMIIIFYVNVTEEYIRKGEYHSQNPQYLNTLREISMLVSAIKQKKEIEELASKKIDPLYSIEDPDLALMNTNLPIKHGQAFSIVITKKENYIYSLDTLPKYVKYIGLENKESGLMIWSFVVNVYDDNKDKTILELVKIKATNVIDSTNVINYGVTLVISNK